MAIVLVIGILLGVAAAFRHGTWLRPWGGPILRRGKYHPAFVTGILLVYVFGVLLGWFPTFGPGAGFADRLWHLALPATAVALSMLAIVVKITRAAVIEELDKDYVAFARSRGLRPARILQGLCPAQRADPDHHRRGDRLRGPSRQRDLRGGHLRAAGTGVAKVIDAVNKRDIPVIQGSTLVFTGFVVIVNLMINVAYALIDPRIRFKRVAG